MISQRGLCRHQGNYVQFRFCGVVFGSTNKQEVVGRFYQPQACSNDPSTSDFSPLVVSVSQRFCWWLLGWWTRVCSGFGPSIDPTPILPKSTKPERQDRHVGSPPWNAALGPVRLLF